MYTLRKFTQKTNKLNLSNLLCYSNFNNVYYFYTSKFNFSEKKIKQTAPSKTIRPTKVPLASPPQANPNAAPIPPNQQITKPGEAQKTPQELNMERLMGQWPETIRNPTNDITLEVNQMMKEVYKYHLGEKAYHKVDDLPLEIYHQTMVGSMTSRTTDTIANLFQEFEGFLTDHQMADRFNMISSTHKDYTKDYYETIVPAIKKMLLKADRGSSHTLYLCTVGGAKAFLGDTEFWEIIVNNINIYKYNTYIHILI